MAEPQIRVAAKCKSTCPHFVVPDVVASAEHYRDVLGFKIMGYWLDPPVFAIVARDDVEIQFGKSDSGSLPSPNMVRRESGLDASAFRWIPVRFRVEIQQAQVPPESNGKHTCVC
jgi:hypothetical protein